MHGSRAMLSDELWFERPPVGLLPEVLAPAEPGQSWSSPGFLC